MTTKQRLTIFGVSDHGYDRMTNVAMEWVSESTCLLLGITVEDYAVDRGLDGDPWYFSGLAVTDVDRIVFEAVLREELNDQCWVLTEAEQSFDWSLPGIQNVRPDLALTALGVHISFLKLRHAIDSYPSSVGIAAGS